MVAALIGRDGRFERDGRRRGIGLVGHAHREGEVVARIVGHLNAEYHLRGVHRAAASRNVVAQGLRRAVLQKEIVGQVVAAVVAPPRSVGVHHDEGSLVDLAVFGELHRVVVSDDGHGVCAVRGEFRQHVGVARFRRSRIVRVESPSGGQRRIGEDAAVDAAVAGVVEVAAGEVDALLRDHFERDDLLHAVLHRPGVLVVAARPFERIGRGVGKVGQRHGPLLPGDVEPLLGESALVDAVVQEIPGVEIAECIGVRGLGVAVQQPVHLVGEQVADARRLGAGAAFLFEYLREVFELRVVHARGQGAFEGFRRRPRGGCCADGPHLVGQLRNLVGPGGLRRRRKPRSSEQKQE